MTATTILAGAISEAERASLFSILAKKMDQACFIDWVVGVVVLAFYAFKLYSGVPLTSNDLWPAVAALAITRAGNTVSRAVADMAYWRWHRPGENGAQDGAV